MQTPVNPLEQARQLLERGDFPGAVAAWQRATRGGKNTFDSDVLGSRIHQASGLKDQAVFLAERAGASAGADLRKLMAAAGVLAQAGMNDKAVELYRKAVALAPSDAGAAACLVGTIFRTGKYDLTLAESTKAIAAHPASPEVALNHATILNFFGRLDEAAATLKRTITANPTFIAGRSNLCMLTNYLTGDPAELFEVHRDFGRMFEAIHKPSDPPFANSKDPLRPIRMGVVSGDLRRGSVMSFFEPLLANLDPSKIQTHVYSLLPAADEVTARLQKLAKSWKNVGEMAPNQVAQEIYQDRIDVLIDLGGHTAYNRLSVFHLRPAPVQVTYLAYPCTTGLSTIDARLVDSKTDPAGADMFASERLVRLDPSFLCFRPPEDAPPVRESRPEGPFVFGSFNNAFKLHPATLDAWARILERTPGSILLLKSQGLNHPEMRQACLDRLTKRGLDGSRIEIAGFTKTYVDHLAMYNRVDLALDSFPYHGTTTTCEALWMGTPVLTVGGGCHAARVGVSLLDTVGLGDWVAPDVDTYIAQAVARAEQPARLDAVRTGLRERMRASPLCDASGFAARFEAAIRELWRGWCRGDRPRHADPRT